MVVAVTGATGQLGRKVIRSLKEKIPASEIIAVVRDPSKAADLGVEVRAGDYGDVASLENALAGVDKLLLISSNSLDERANHHSNAIDAAKKAGVKHIVYTGILHADRLEVALASDHKLTEQKLAAAGIPYTILRNGWYWENATANFGPSLQHGALVGGAGEGRISFASRQDFADAAIAVLTGTGHDGKVYELAGDNAYTLAELAAETARQSGRPLEYRNLDQPGYAGFLESVGLPKGFAAILAEVEAQGLGTGLLRDDSHTLSKLAGRPTTTLDQAVEEALRS